MSMVAADTPFSESAAQRHFRNHTNAQQLAVLRSLDAATLHVHDVAERLLSLADEASRVRSVSTDPRTHLLAVREEASVLTALVNRLGIESSETVEALREARALAVAVSSVLSDRPDVAAALSRDLSAQGETHLAHAFLKLASDASSRRIVGGTRLEVAQ